MKRSTVRLAALVMVVVMAALLLAGGVGFGMMHANLSARQDARILEIFASIQPFMEENDTAELIEVITSRIAASPDRSSIYRLEDTLGQVLAASAKGVVPPDGWSSLPAGTAGLATGYSYRVYRQTVAGFTLTVGLSDADIDDIADIMGGALAWSAIIVVALTFALGALLAVRMQRRLTVIDDVLHRVSQGDLSQRLVLSDRHDDLDRMASSINTTLARLETNVAAMRQVSADIAHDLRTPLNRLKIWLEQAREQSQAGQNPDKALASAMEESDRITAIFSALLRISQIESGARSERFQATDLAEIISSVTDVYGEVAHDAGLTLLPFTAPVAVVQGDADLLTQMFANLIENAIRHCPTGSTISIGLTSGAGGPVATVADTGPGIPKAEREKVLHRLYRMDKSRTTPGSGLGLSLVKAVADLHQATLILKDTDPDAARGLTVQISFPATASSLE